MYLTKTPKFVQSLFPNFLWRVPDAEHEVFLTFDDGPIPEVTPWVLDQLDKFDAKATFFCVGENVQKHPEVFDEVQRRGHLVGNHTYNHLSGWQSENLPYFHNVRRCANLVHSDLFRPPYGRLRPKQVQFLQRHYKIVMWDVLSGDFDPNITAKQCLRNVITHTKPGSIVVFHDSLKSENKLRKVLPTYLSWLAENDFTLNRLPSSLTTSEVVAKIA
ncbi:MAG: polysaccharide deacetylase family protein [Saprospiraceae bacterium]|nr:polysaccharide deacetylase family protein [Saprospiraceae bacterium]